jgi:putative thioredoxin
MPIEIQSFEEDVLEKSRSIPVLVDFWAPWCGPCRVLGPVLERLAAEQSDRWALVKINTDEHQELSIRYGIRGIPAVKLFIDGEVANEFTGALPEHAVRTWLDETIPTESRRLWSDAREKFFSGDHDSARPLLAVIVEEEPTNAEARVLLAAVNVWTDPDSSARSLDKVEIVDPAFIQVASSVRQVAESLSAAALPEGAGRAPLGAAIDALREGSFDTAARELTNTLSADRLYDDDHARRLGVALFTLLGAEHPVTKEHRRSFDMALY